VKTNAKKTLGSLFAGIGGFDLGFERAGWETKWQVELNPVNRAVLADRFPTSKRFEDVRQCGAKNLEHVDCITAGFPCQDISTAGRCKLDKDSHGLNGARSGLFFEALRIAREVQPTWLVLENVAALLASNDCEDIERVVTGLAECGYLGFFRVLNAQHFGVPQARRRIFLVAGLGRYPAFDYLADAAAMESIPCSLEPFEVARDPNSFVDHTLCATNAACQIGLGHEVLVAHADGWSQMVEREREISLHGIPSGLDELNLAEAYAAGNAVVPAVAQWIAEKLAKS
jgi:DNA (cytosine-5)-methyltransferase 1